MDQVALSPELVIKQQSVSIASSMQGFNSVDRYTTLFPAIIPILFI
jgi:hypothetical protein